MAGLLTVGSIYSPRLPDLFVDRSVAICGFRPRTQRRVRTGISPVSLLGPKGTITLHEKFMVTNKLTGIDCQGFLLLKFVPTGCDQVSRCELAELGLVACRLGKPENDTIFSGGFGD